MGSPIWGSSTVPFNLTLVTLEGKFNVTRSHEMCTVRGYMYVTSTI